MILNIANSDYSNFAFDNLKAMKYAGVECSGVKLKKHRFNYTEELSVCNFEYMYKKIQEADIIQIFHSDISLLKMCVGFDKKINVYHTGTLYRQMFEKINRIFNPHIDKSFLALGEFFGLGAKNENYIVGSIDTNKYKYSYNHKKENRTIGHFPSDTKIKGTNIINDIVRRTGFGNVYRFDSDYCVHERFMQKLNDCAIYIELFAPQQEGMKYGSWGITALEAAVLGKVVITQNLSNDIYERSYGDCPFILCNSILDLEKSLVMLMNMDEDEFLALQKATRRWVEDKHSYLASGKYLKNIYEDEFVSI